MKYVVKYERIFFSLIPTLLVQITRVFQSSDFEQEFYFYWDIS